MWAYAITLLVFLIMHAQRGNYVWRRSVREAHFEAGVPAAGPTATLYAEGKPHEVAALHTLPPSATASPQPTGHMPYPQV